jgi:hypothetical protein
MEGTTARSTLKVNSKNQSIDAEPDMTLLYALCNDLQLNGPKFRCGLSQYGGCTVIMDGNAIRSCVTLVTAGAKQVRHYPRRPGHDQEDAQDPAGLYRRAGGAVR